VRVAGGAVLVGLVEMGVFDESVVGEKKKESLGGQLAQARGQVELEVLKDVAEEIFQSPPLRVHSFIDAAEFPQAFRPPFPSREGLFHRLLQKLHPNRGRRF